MTLDQALELAIQENAVAEKVKIVKKEFVLLKKEKLYW